MILARVGARDGDYATPHLESALAAEAHRRGMASEALALVVLRQQLVPATPPTPLDEWECRLFAAAVDCGVSVPDAALSSDGLYE